MPLDILSLRHCFIFHTLLSLRHCHYFSRCCFRYAVFQRCRCQLRYDRHSGAEALYTRHYQTTVTIHYERADHSCSSFVAADVAAAPPCHTLPCHYCLLLRFFREMSTASQDTLRYHAADAMLLPARLRFCCQRRLRQRCHVTIYAFDAAIIISIHTLPAREYRSYCRHCHSTYALCHMSHHGDNSRYA